MDHQPRPAPPDILPAGIADRVLARVDADHQARLDLLARLVETNSATGNHAGIRACGQLCAAALRAIGFVTDWLDAPPAADRAGHLRAVRPGTATGAGPGTRLLLLGHLDTVHAPDSPFRRFERHGARATGPGIEDMKNGVVVMISALRAVAEAGLLDRLNMTVLLTGDEEEPAQPWQTARAPLQEAAAGRDVVLSFEPGEPGVAVTARRGASVWTLRCTAEAGHSGLLGQPDQGFGASYELARILDGFRALAASEDRVTINPARLAAGTTCTAAANDVGARGRTNVIAAEALAWGDVRCLSPAQRARVHAAMADLAAAPLPGCAASIVFDDLVPPMAETASSRDLLAAYSRCSERAGGPPLAANDPRFRGGGDISFVAERIPACLDGLGGWGGDAHAGTEWLDLETFQLAARRAALLIAWLAQGGRAL